ncbi:MAG: hypothetical protein AAF391_07755 [Bacteroidota bacterium]
MKKLYYMTPIITALLISITLMFSVSVTTSAASHSANETAEATANIQEETIDSSDDTPPWLAHPHAPAILIQIDSEEGRPSAIGEEGEVTIYITPTIQIEDVTVRMHLVGSVTSEGAPDFNYIKPIEPFVEDLARGKSYEVTRPVSPTREVTPITLPFSVELGKGYILVSVESSATETQSTTLFVLGTEDEIFYSQISFTDLDFQDAQKRIQERQGEPSGSSEPVLSADLLSLLRSDAEVIPKLEIRPLPLFEPGTNDPEDTETSVLDLSTTIKGHISFTDKAGNMHPIRFATVEIWDRNYTSDDKIINTVQSDKNGFYSVTITLKEVYNALSNEDRIVDNEDSAPDEESSDGLSPRPIIDNPLEIYVDVKAEGDAIKIVHPGHHRAWRITSKEDGIYSADAYKTIELNMIATNRLDKSAHVAFEAYEAINYLAGYLEQLEESRPPTVTVVYPREGSDDISYYRRDNNTIYLAMHDIHDWDNIHHEYSHNVQNVYNMTKKINISRNTNYNINRNIDHNNCEKEEIEYFVRLAWSEAWATAFALIAQSELELGKLDIPYLGDTEYNDIKPDADEIRYDLELLTDQYRGERNEVAIQRILWDLYDKENDDADVDISVEASVLWDLVKGKNISTFSEFWTAFVSKLSSDELLLDDILTYTGILADHQVAPYLSSSQADVKIIGDTLEFYWEKNLCASEDQQTYSLKALINGEEEDVIVDLEPGYVDADLTPFLNIPNNQDIVFYIAALVIDSSKRGKELKKSEKEDKLVK